MSWKTLKSKTIIKNRFFNLLEESYKKTDGKIINKFYTVKRKDATVIAAFTKDKKIVLISQYRPSIKILDIELPAGYMEKWDKNIKQTAERELLEETGYKSKKLVKMGEAFASTGFMSNKVHFFIGFDAEKISGQKLDNNEEIEVKVTSWKNALGLIKKGKIKDLGSVAGMMLAEKYLKNLR
jgi:ADP-ribose pyrophosphatase